MKLIIDIPRKTYEHIRSCGGHGIFNIQGEDNLTVTKAIFNSHSVSEAQVVERPQGEWIPVSDKLPTIDGEYLVTIKYMTTYDGVTYKPIYVRDIQNYLSSKNGFGDMEYQSGDYQWISIPVIAWMPLPESYMETENEH